MQISVFHCTGIVVLCSSKARENEVGRLKKLEHAEMHRAERERERVECILSL